jgi:hypothetical protein
MSECMYVFLNESVDTEALFLNMLLVSIGHRAKNKAILRSECRLVFMCL